MIYNNTEIESMDGVETYTKQPTWVDTFKASTKNFTSVSLSNSKYTYVTDEYKNNIEQWKKNDPDNSDLYDRLGKITPDAMERLQFYYENGKLDKLNTTYMIKENPFDLSSNIFMVQDFKKYKELEKIHGLKPQEEIFNDARVNAVKDFTQSTEVLKNSDSLSAEMLGTVWGALHDPKTLATLPLGTFKTGGTVLGNAGRAMAEEMGIEALAQVGIAPEVYSWKKEIGLKTSIKQEAYNAVMSIGGAGLVRGTGSAVFDLSEKGLKALKMKDPELAQAYQDLSAKKPTEDLESHIDNMQIVEFEKGRISKIENPNEEGIKLNNEPIIKESEDFKIEIEQQPEDLKMVIDKDIEGNVVQKSYKEINKELDDEEKLLKEIEDCLLGVK